MYTSAQICQIVAAYVRALSATKRGEQQVIKAAKKSAEEDDDVYKSSMDDNGGWWKPLYWMQVVIDVADLSNTSWLDVSEEAEPIVLFM